MKMMNYILCALAFFSISSVFGQSKSPDMTVFGYTMGKPFNIPECKKELKIDRSAKYYSYYKSYDSIVCDCYQIPNIFYYQVKKKTPLMPSETELHKDDTVFVYFKPTNIPKISSSERFVAAVANTNLIEVVFYTRMVDADFVLNELTQKYGKNHSLKYYRSQNGYGGVKNYYIARWEFSDLLVTYQSDATYYSSTGGEVVIRLMDPNRFNAPKGRGL